jgi:hypothetical protein
MELVAKEHANAPGREWKPITDTYLQGAAFTSLSTSPEREGTGSGVSIEDVAPPKPAAKGKGGKSMAEGHKAIERAK